MVEADWLVQLCCISSCTLAHPSCKMVALLDAFTYYPTYPTSICCPKHPLLQNISIQSLIEETLEYQEQNIPVHEWKNRKNDCYIKKEKKLYVEDKMNTNTGRKIAAHRHQFMEQFLKQFYDEWNGKK